MKAYKVTAPKPDGLKNVLEIVTAKADIAKAKSRLNVVFGVRKSAVSVNVVEIPTTKQELIGFINGLITEAQA